MLGRGTGFSATSAFFASVSAEAIAFAASGCCVRGSSTPPRDAGIGAGTGAVRASLVVARSLNGQSKPNSAAAFLCVHINTALTVIELILVISVSKLLEVELVAQNGSNATEATHKLIAL